MKHTLLLIMVAMVGWIVPAYPSSATSGIGEPAVAIVPKLQRVIDSHCDARYDGAALQCAYWVLNTPLDVAMAGGGGAGMWACIGCPDRRELCEFMLTWMDMTQRMDVKLGSEVYPMLDNPDMLVAYLAASIIYSLENDMPHYGEAMMCNSLCEAVRYYQHNRATIGYLGGMELLRHFRDNGEIQSYILDIAPMIRRPEGFDTVF